MSFSEDRQERLDQLEDQLRRAHGVTGKLIADAIAHGCVRFAACGGVARASLERLIGSGAWTDAALALSLLEIPYWKLRRLVYEDGEWHCTFSKQPALPPGLDETAEASHESLPLAILIALIEALRQGSTAAETRSGSVPQVRPAQGHAVCCDNFA
jgi:hypothetical protein